MSMMWELRRIIGRYGGDERVYRTWVTKSDALGFSDGPLFQNEFQVCQECRKERYVDVSLCLCIF